MREELIALEYHTDLLTDRRKLFTARFDLLILQADLAALDRLQRIDTAQQRGFSATARTNDYDDLSLMYCQVDVIQYSVIFVFLCNMLNVQHRFSHGYYLHFFSRCRASRLMGQQARKYSRKIVR